MHLEESYLQAYGELKKTLETIIPTAQEAIALIDLTLLDESADEQALLRLNEKANLYQVAALCVLPQHIKQMRPIGNVRLATVANFPEGDQSTQHVLTAIDELLSIGNIDEIDYVFPHQIYLEGEKQAALSQCQLVYQLCQQAKVTFKVILETGSLPSLEFIYQLSTAVINGGCDFLKTSTGKIVQGATLSSAFSILKAIKDTNTPCGLKVSGGIKRPEQAFTYMTLASQVLERNPTKSWFRIGASSLLNALI